MSTKARLKEEYDTKIRKDLQKELKVASIMDVPRLEKIVINTGLGEATEDFGIFESAEKELAQISGQKPVRTISRKAISGFKIRKGEEIGLMVTLRCTRMWEFFDKFVNVVLPRTKDFRGMKPSSFDGSGNYSVGVEDQTAFPEIDPNEVKKEMGMQIVIVTSTDNDEHAKALLDKFDFPFIENG